MKSPKLWIAFSLALAAPLGAREFEDKYGRIIDAELVSHAGADASKVTIDKGGREFEVEISLFSERDQQFIRDWMKSTPPKLRYAFRVEAEKKKLSSTSRGSTYSRSKTQVYVYEIKVTNLTRQPVRDIRVEYLAFMKGGWKSTEGDTVAIPGPMRYNETKIINTKPVTLSSSRYSSYYSSYSSKDSLLGVLVRVYDPQGNIIEDFRTTGTQFKGRWPTRPRVATTPAPGTGFVPD